MKYRNAGILTGLDMDDATGLTPDAFEDVAAAKLEAFVDDLEAIGPTLVKIVQALSTRADMVPPAYLSALERI